MKIKCPKCNYEWDTTSEMMFITCPNCRLKIENKQSKTNREKENKLK